MSDFVLGIVCIELGVAAMWIGADKFEHHMAFLIAGSALITMGIACIMFGGSRRCIE